MIYLYGLLEATATGADAISGMAGVTAPIALAPVPGAILIYGPHPGTEILPKRRNLLAHAQVLEAAAWFGLVLPMRFGMSASGLDEVEGLVLAQAADVAAAFERIRDRIELGLRIAFPREAALRATLAGAPDLASERARLLALPRPDPFAQAEFGRRLAERLDARRGLAQRRLIEKLRPLWSDYRLRTPEEDVQILAVDLLLPEGEQTRFAAALEEAATGCDFAPGADPLIRIIGPVPPFNFVNLTLLTRKPEAA